MKLNTSNRGQELANRTARVSNRFTSRTFQIKPLAHARGSVTEKLLLVPITFISTSRRMWVTGASENKYTKGTMKKTILLIAIVAALQTMTVAILAQNGPGRGPRDAGPGGHRPPPSPVVGVLDGNHDRVIDAQEIAKSSNVLKALDANGDGQVTHDEFCPPPPDGGPGGQR